MIEPPLAAGVLSELYHAYRTYLKLTPQQKARVGGYGGLVNRTLIKGVGSILVRRGSPIYALKKLINAVRSTFGGEDRIAEQRRELIEVAWQSFDLGIERWRREKYQKEIVRLRQIAAGAYGLEDFNAHWEDFSLRVKLLADDIPTIRKEAALEIRFARDVINHHNLIPEGHERNDVEALLVYLNGKCQFERRGEVAAPLYQAMHAALIKQNLTRRSFDKHKLPRVDVDMLIDDLAQAYVEGVFDRFSFPPPRLTDPVAAWGLRDKAIEAMARALKGTRYLRFFRFDGTGIEYNLSDLGLGAFCQNLRKCPYVLQIELPYNSISKVGIKSLGEALPRMIHFHDLNLEGNHLGGEAAEALANTLRSVKELSNLNLANTSLDNGGVIALGDNLRRHRYLDHINLSKNPIDEQAMIGVARIIAGNSVKVLSLSDCAIGDDGAKIIAAALRGNTSIRALHFNNCDLGNEGAMALRQALKTARRGATLDLSDNVIEKDPQESFERIHELGQQMELLLRGEPAYEETERLIQAIEELGAKDPGKAPKTRLEMIKALHQGTHQLEAQAREAQQNGNEIDPTLPNQLLYQVYAKNHPNHTIGYAFTHLGKGKTSQYLQEAVDRAIRENNLVIGDEGARVLADKLTYSRDITRLTLRDQNITEVGAEFLGKALAKNISLVHLDLQNNPMQDEGLAFIAEGLKRNSSLKWLNLQNCEVYLKGFQLLAEVIGSNRSLTQLEIQENVIAEKGLIALMDGLARNKGLGVFSVSGCVIGRDGATAIATALAKNRTLRDVRFLNSEIGDSEAMSIAEGLKKNRTLKQVIFKNCSLTDDGALAIDKALKEHPEIEHLDLTQNQITTDTKGMIMIRTGYRYFKSL